MLTTPSFQSNPTLPQSILTLMSVSEPYSLLMLQAAHPAALFTTVLFAGTVLYSKQLVFTHTQEHKLERDLICFVLLSPLSLEQTGTQGSYYG